MELDGWGFWVLWEGTCGRRLERESSIPIFYDDTPRSSRGFDRGTMHMKFARRNGQSWIQSRLQQGPVKERESTVGSSESIVRI